MDNGSLIPTIIAYLYLAGYVAVIVDLIITIIDSRSWGNRK